MASMFTCTLKGTPQGLTLKYMGRCLVTFCAVLEYLVGRSLWKREFVTSRQTAWPLRAQCRAMLGCIAGGVPPLTCTKGCVLAIKSSDCPRYHFWTAYQLTWNKPPNLLGSAASDKCCPFWLNFWFRLASLAEVMRGHEPLDCETHLPGGTLGSPDHF